MAAVRWVILTALALVALRGVAAAQSAIPPGESLAALMDARPLPADLLQLAHELRATPIRPIVRNETTPSYAEGRVDQFWIGHAEGKEPHQIDAELRLVTRHAYWYVQR